MRITARNVKAPLIYESYVCTKVACSPCDSYQTFPQAKKLNTNVSIPREALDLKQLGLISENATDDTAPIYDLYGVSNHMGSTEGGHYTADCKNAISRVWYNYDDSHVSEGSFDELDGRAAYLLFYCRQDTYGRGRLI